MRLPIGILMIWKAAAYEAALTNHATIEPVHLFLALLKVCDIDPREAVRGNETAGSAAIETELALLRSVFYDAGINTSELRRRGRAAIKKTNISSLSMVEITRGQESASAIDEVDAAAGSGMDTERLAALLYVLLKKNNKEIKSVLDTVEIDRLSLLAIVEKLVPAPSCSRSVIIGPLLPIKKNNTKDSPEKSDGPSLDISGLGKWGKNLSHMAAEGKLEPVTGRENEIRELAKVVCRRTDNNATLVGEPGVGKTSVVRGLAVETVKPNSVKAVRDLIIFELDISALAAVGRRAGSIDKLEAALTEIENANSGLGSHRIILFIDDIRDLFGSGAGVPANAAEILKTYIERGNLSFVFTATPHEYREYIENNSALARRFQKVAVAEPSPEQTFEILKNLKAAEEDHYGNIIPDETLRSCIDLSVQYMAGQFLPAKAAVLLQDACSETAMNTIHISSGTIRAANPESEGTESRCVTSEDVMLVISRRYGIPMEALLCQPGERLSEIENIIRKRVIGQEEAVGAVVSSVIKSYSGFGVPNRPHGVLLFVGPTGVGKTELAKALCEALFGNENRLVRFDMSEFMEKHSLSRLLGSPPGYVGYDEESMLSRALRDGPHAVILFDEVEKAHSDILNIFLQMFDEGVVTDNQGHKINFSETFIILTSNLKVEPDAQPDRVGFRTAREEGAAVENDYDRESRVRRALTEQIRPEILNRINKIVLFNPLRKEDMRKIAEKILMRRLRLLKTSGIKIMIHDGVYDYLIDMGYSEKFGVREMERAIDNCLINSLSRKLMEPGASKRTCLSIGFDSGKITFE